MIQVVLATAIGRVAQTGTALDVVDPTDPITILAPLVAVLAAVAVAYMPRRIGQDTRFQSAKVMGRSRCKMSHKQMSHKQSSSSMSSRRTGSQILDQYRSRRSRTSTAKMTT